MPIPVAAAAVPLGAKILGGAGALIKGAIPFAKGLTGLGGAVKGSMAFGKGRFAKRMAGEALNKVGSAIGAKAPTGIKDGISKAGNLIIGPDLMSPQNRGDLMFRLAPDAAFGLMGAAMTPGDLGDKAIAGTTQFLGGGLTGIAASRGAKALGASQRVADMVDMGGSVIGDFGGMAVGDGIMRIKGGGTTPYEKAAAEQDEMYRAQIMQELKQQYGLM